MPSKYGSENRPPSPYSSRQSPRPKNSNKTKMWRPLSGGGNHHQTNPQLESSREMWLKSLRQGTVQAKHFSGDETFKRKTDEEYWISTFRSDTSINMRKSPIKAVHGLNSTNGSANLALVSSSDYLKEQLGITSQPRHRRSGSWSGGASSQPGTPRYKPQEEMYDEIMQLKKTVTSQKNEYDSLKSKVRRLEEENIKKDKTVDQLIEQYTILEGSKSKGKPAENKLIVTTLKQRQIKLEHTIKEKDLELKTARDRIKNLRGKAREAKSSYMQEVVKLQGALTDQEAELSRQNNETLSNDGDDSTDQPPTTKVGAMRQAVVKLTAENSRLEEENRSLKRDLDRALDGSEDGSVSEEIKYSALSRPELTAIIKKSKKEEKNKIEEERKLYKEEQDRLKQIIRKLKDEKNELRNQNSHQVLEIEKLNEEKEKMKEDHEDIMRHAKQEKEYHKQERQNRKRASVELDAKKERFRQNHAAKSIQRQWKQHKQSNEDDDALRMIQSSFRGHLARQDHLNKSDHMKAASKQRSSSRPISPRSNSSLLAVDEMSGISDYGEDTEEDVNVIQASMRGHLARSDHIKYENNVMSPTHYTSRPSTAGSGRRNRKTSNIIFD